MERSCLTQRIAEAEGQVFLDLFQSLAPLLVRICVVSVLNQNSGALRRFCLVSHGGDLMPGFSIGNGSRLWNVIDYP